MGIMEVIRKWKDKKSEKSEKFKQLQEDDRLNEMLIERKKSANRRELEKYYHEKEEKEIKEALDKIRKQQTKDSWKSSPITKGTNILKNDRPILKEKNIFVDHRNDIPFTKKGDMFFKW